MDAYSYLLLAKPGPKEQQDLIVDFMSQYISPALLRILNRHRRMHPDGIPENIWKKNYRPQLMSYHSDDIIVPIVHCFDASYDSVFLPANLLLPLAILALDNKLREMATEQIQPQLTGWYATPAVVLLAQTILTTKRYGDVPVLADALEEAGCTDRAILDHCREKRKHSELCWVLKLITGS